MWCWRINVDQVCLPHQAVRKLWFVLSTTTKLIHFCHFGTLQFTMGHSVHISCHNGKWLIYLRINKFVISANIVLVFWFFHSAVIFFFPIGKCVVSELSWRQSCSFLGAALGVWKSECLLWWFVFWLVLHCLSLEPVCTLLTLYLLTDFAHRSLLRSGLSNLHISVAALTVSHAECVTEHAVRAIHCMFRIVDHKMH